MAATAVSSGFRGAKLGLILIVALVIAALAALDRWLAQTEESEMHNSAQRAYHNGMTLLRNGNTTQAVDSLRTAHALERQNEQYELGLIQALMAARKIDEAEPLMNEVLQDNPNDSEANLIAARLMVNKNHARDAEAYYHRAIYGDWPSDPAAHRIAARMELIQFLQSRGRSQELLAELLPLEQEAANDQPLQLKLAHLLLAAGSPSRSADLYRAILARDPQNMTAYLGLAEADLARGEYTEAHVNFLRASYHDEHDPWIRSRLDLSSSLAALDPTVRQLSSLDKYRRSARILELARNDLQQCLSKKPNASSAEIAQLLSAAAQIVPARLPKHVTNDMAEKVLANAGKIWQARLKTCGELTNSSEEPLRLIMLKLAQ